MQPFKKDDICICTRELLKVKSGKPFGVGPSVTRKDDCRVRIIKAELINLEFQDPMNSKYCYNVYNLDYKRYEKIGGIYLRLLPDETREYKLKKLFNEESNK